MEQICGTCKYWQEGNSETVGSVTFRVELPICQLLKRHKEANHPPESWCWKEADPWDLVIRKRAGLIEGDYE